MSHRLSKKEYRRYVAWLNYTFKVCQICNQKQAQDAHHLRFGCYGADKDDTSLIAVCRDCHNWCHKNKQESKDKYKDIASSNWRSYTIEEL